MDPKCCKFFIREKTARKLTQVRDVQPPTKEETCQPPPTKEESPEQLTSWSSRFFKSHVGGIGHTHECDPCDDELWMSEVQAKALHELLYQMAICAERKFSQDEPVDVTAPKKRIQDDILVQLRQYEWQKEFLLMHLEIATKEAEEACVKMNKVEAEVSPGSRAKARRNEAVYKALLERDIRPFNDMRRRVHAKAKLLTAIINKSTLLMYDPLKAAIREVGKRTGPWHPLSGIVSDLSLDLLHKVGKQFFAEYAGSPNFARTVANCLDHNLNYAAWVVFAMDEFLAAKGPKFPTGKTMDVDANYEGPTPPSCPAIGVEDWRAIRDSFQFLKETKISRSILRGADETRKEARATFPAFPDRDEERIMSRCVDREYFRQQAQLFRGKWAISAFMKQKVIKDHHHEHDMYQFV